jgi:hypothetical protein
VLAVWWLRFRTRKGQQMNALAMNVIEAEKPIVRNWTLELVPVADVKIDPRYHDPARFQDARAKKMAATFDLDKVGVITVAERSGMIRILIDGAHRVAAAKLAGVTHLPAKVYRNISQIDESRIFRGLSDSVRLRQEHIWRARVFEQEPKAMAIVTVLDRHGVRIAVGTNQLPNVTGAILAVERVYDSGLLDRTLGMLRTAWPEDPHALDAVPILGVGSFLDVYANDFPHPRYKGDQRLLEKLSEYPASALIRNAKEIAAIGAPGSTGGSQSRSTGGSNRGLTSATYQRRAVLFAYNRRVQHKLPDTGQSELKLLTLGKNPWG